MTRRLPRRSTVVLVLFLVQIVLAGTLGATRIRLSRPYPALPDTAAFAFEQPVNALTLMTGRERADEIARAWDPDAELVYASMQIDWPSDQPPETVTSVSPFGWLRFVYQTGTTGRTTSLATLSLFFERVSGRLVRQTVNNWSEAFPPGDRFAAISTTDTTAVLGAEIGGATAFRAACPEIRNRTTVSLVLDTETGQPVWIIGYSGKNGDLATGMVFRINAATGQSAVTRQPPPCPTS